MAEQAFARLPAEVRTVCAGLAIRVEDFPSDEVLHDLVHGPRQEAAPAASTGPVAIGWGRKDRLTPVRPDAPPSCSPTRAWSGSTAPGTSRTGTDQRRPMCLILAPTG